MPSDDENESGETEAYTLTSASGLEYYSDATLADMLFQMRELVGTKGNLTTKNLTMLRAMIEDAWSIVAVNEDVMASDTLDVIDGLEELPAGWTSDADEDEDEE